MQDSVIVLHGIMQPAAAMKGLCRHLVKHGFRVLNVSYPSTRHPIDTLADIVHDAIEPFRRAGEGRLHLVGFSMGGLVIRAYLKRHRPDNLGRVVMAGTPNHGSEVADYLRDFKPFVKLFGPAGQQLVTDQSAFADLFASDGFEVGIISGDLSLNFVTSRIIGTPNDGKVSVESSRLPSARDHVVIHTTHTLLPMTPRMWREASSFLSHGRFGELADAALRQAATA
jgi:triacylglycerol esterase/lipase EstA (alpha/beta hydrolase family)